ncbi:hypothetical protein Ddye_008327 [Dipteronia dyeriana]|uniref:SOUL heme-binding protein n=1 Tax=Dipteronia dyeriana TaxID=168575 RepID=A0AAD9X9A1_9ROSI|nr:hypothetical protein Ddye_008327 [Dipteronia dyeriana]
MLLCKPSLITHSLPKTPNKSSLMISNSIATSDEKKPMSAFEARLSLVFALACQTSSLSQRRICHHFSSSIKTLIPLTAFLFFIRLIFISFIAHLFVVLTDLATETAKYVFPKRFESRNLEEALMTVPDIETVKYKVLSRSDQYEIREVESYFIAEVTMPGKSGFYFNGASQSFNVLAEYLFGKNTTAEKMEMTTPVITRKAQSDGEKMQLTTPVITKRQDQEKWQMSFVLPAKYGADLPLPKDPSVRIKEVPSKVVAVVAFSGFVTDEEVKQRELKLRNALKDDKQFQVKGGASVEAAQYNPPFTLPFTRRNEIALEVERKEE